jgi:translation initiation factor 1
MNNSGSPKAKIYLVKRAGKSITIVSGLHTYGEDRLKAIAKELKVMCGAGGTVKDGVIEIQGDNVERVKVWFANSVQ